MSRREVSSGKIASLAYARALAGYNVSFKSATGSKPTRAKPVASAIRNGILNIYEDEWTYDLVDQMGAFPDGEHDDEVDALSGAYAYMPKGDDNGSFWILKNKRSVNWGRLLFWKGAEAETQRQAMLGQERNPGERYKRLP